MSAILSLFFYYEIGDFVFRIKQKNAFLCNIQLIIQLNITNIRSFSNNIALNGIIISSSVKIKKKLLFNKIKKPTYEKLAFAVG